MQANGTHTQKAWVKYVLISAVAVYLLWLLGLPLLTLVLSSFEQGWRKIYEQLFSYQAWHAFLLTFILCLSAVLINTVFGILTAMVMVRQKFWGQKLINGLFDLPFALSAVVVGYMFILLFGRGGWFESIKNWTGFDWVFSFPGMLIATLFVTFPFMVRELVPVLKELGSQQEEAAYTLGASPWKTFWKVTLPNIKWGVLYGMSLTFARALGEFGAVLVVGAGIAEKTETATIYVFHALEERWYAGAYGASLLLILMAFLLLLAMELLKKRSHS